MTQNNSALANREETNPIVYQAHGESGEVSLSVHDIRTFLCPAATLEEATMFLKVCQYQGLNPFIYDAYLVVYGHGDNRNVSIITGKDTFTKRAHRHPQFEGFQAGVVIQTKGGEILEREGTLLGQSETLIGGWATVYRQGRRFPFKQVVNLKEFDTGNRSWKGMKGTMIRKVALVQALREAFPEDLGGLYDSAEMKMTIPEGGKPEYDGEPARYTDDNRQPLTDRAIDQGERAVVESENPTGSTVPGNQERDTVYELGAAELLLSGQAVGPQLTAKLNQIVSKEEWTKFKQQVTDWGVPGDEVARIIAEDKRLESIVKLANGTPRPSVLKRGLFLVLQSEITKLYGEATQATDVMAPERPPEVADAPVIGVPDGADHDTERNDEPIQPPTAPPAPAVVVDQQGQPASAESDEDDQQLPFD